MIGPKPRGLSAEQKAELWKRWKAGQSLQEIGRAPDLIEQQFALLPGMDIEAGGREPLLTVLMDVVEEIAAGHGDLRRESTDCLHAMCLAESLLKHAQPREVFDDHLDRLRRE